MSNLNRFLKTSGIYFVGNVLSKVIAFLLIPLYTRVLSPSEFGEYDLVITMVSFFVPVLFLQIWDAMFRFSFDEDKISGKYGVISNSYFTFFISILIYIMSFYLVFQLIYFEYSLLIFFYGLLIAFQYQYTFVARVFLKNKLFVVSGLINSLVSAGVNILLILILGMGIESLYIAAIVGCLAQILIIEFSLSPLKYFNKNFIDKEKIVEMLKFSIPLCIATLSYWLLSGYAKIVIIKDLGSYENGLFAIASRFSFFISMLISVFQFAWNEMAYIIAKNGDRAQKYEMSIIYIFQFITIGGAILMLIVKMIYPVLIDSNYSESLMIIPLTLIGVVFNSFAGFIGTIFLAEKHTKPILYTTFIGAILNIFTLHIFTPIWGLQGAIGALCLSFFILAITRVYMISRLLSLKLPMNNFIFLVILLFLTVYVFYVFNSNFWLLLFTLLLIVILIFTLRELFSPVLKKALKNIKK